MKLYSAVLTIVIFALLAVGTFAFAHTLLAPHWPTEIRIYCILWGLMCLALAAFLGKLRMTAQNSDLIMV